MTAVALVLVLVLVLVQVPVPALAPVPVIAAWRVATLRVVVAQVLRLLIVVAALEDLAQRRRCLPLQAGGGKGSSLP